LHSRHKLVAGNWKLNGTRSSVVALAEAIAKGATGLSCDILLCPSVVHLADVLNVVGNTPVRLGAQDSAAYESGAYTGEYSAQMMTEFGCEYVIIGHSERRQIFSESDDVVAAKFAAAQKARLTPVLCVGETLEQRNSGDAMTVIERQLDAVFFGVSGDAAVDAKHKLLNVVVAYEPVWAIGTGETASPEQAQEVHAAIRSKLAQIDTDASERAQILYGGSVKPANAEALFAQPDIDGGLIGGASLQADEFLAICQCAQTA